VQRNLVRDNHTNLQRRNQVDPQDRCFLNGATRFFSVGNFQFVQAPGHIVLLSSFAHTFRIIRLEDGPPLADRVKLWQGDSRGRWEGNTLVVETTNFNGKNSFRGSTENLRVTERFTRLSEDAIQYRFTVEDKTMWSRPWSAEVPLKKTVGPIFEHACHEGNYGLYNTLVGARLEEKKAAEQKRSGDGVK
jgi:hypothetical protein